MSIEQKDKEQLIIKEISSLFKKLLDRYEYRNISTLLYYCKTANTP